MAHKKAGGSTVLGRDSASKRLGVKIYGGQIAVAGSIIVRQRGTKFHPAKNVVRGGDDTLYSKIRGKVKFSTKKTKNFSGVFKKRRFVSVEEVKK